jgi:uncharacterized LabA/DUF88 family protein
MDRFALFVDAGHLLAEGGSLCCGTKSRNAILCDYRGLIAELGNFCTVECGLPMLRTYWYDGAKDAVPTPEQLLIAQLPRTKLRLGRLSGGKQKGVDSLIVRDLMTLARERAVATAFLLGGDEDLREGMVAAQEMGVAVNVLGIPTTHAGTGNQAESLIREADQHLMLPTAFLVRFITLRTATAAPAAADAATPAPEPTAAQVDSAAVTTAASEFAVAWHAAQPPEAIETLMAGLPVIPKPLDMSLLNGVESAVGQSLRGRDDLRKDARAAFWQVIRTLSSHVDSR